MSTDLKCVETKHTEGIKKAENFTKLTTRPSTTRKLFMSIGLKRFFRLLSV